jgi:hypothetical protein
MNRLVIASLTIAVSGGAVAQHGGGHTPYAGLEQRIVKALSAEQIGRSARRPRHEPGAGGRA